MGLTKKEKEEKEEKEEGRKEKEEILNVLCQTYALLSGKLALWTLALERFSFVIEFIVFPKVCWYFFFLTRAQIYEGIYQNPSDPTPQLTRSF